MTRNEVGSTDRPSPTPPPGARWKLILTLVIAAVVIFFIGALIGGGSGVAATSARLWSMVTFAVGDETTADSAVLKYYTCGMHPWVILPEPGTCPICRMDLIQLDTDKFTGEITIDPVITQNIGVRIEPVVSGPLVKTIRTVGTVEYDETTVRDISIKVSGWIEKLHVDFLGAEVAEGDPLFDLYSRDLFSAQEEYLLSYRIKGQTDSVADAATGAGDLLDAARTRLEFYDVTPQQIQELQANDRPAKAMTIVSPHRGVVIAKHANEGMYVDPGMQIYRIADLSTVWVMVTLYEYQLPFVEVGQQAVMTLPYIPGRTFQGRVVYIYPYLETTTRQIKVRLEFANPVGLLKPGMYANVELKNTLARERTLVPRAAVIDTGKRQVVFASLGGGKFEPRNVRVGVETDDGMIEILDGLQPGEMVVTSGQFLLDSEANMREALAKMLRGNLASEQEAGAPTTRPSEQEAGAPTTRPSELAALPADAEQAIGTILEAYFAIGNALAGDSIKDIPSNARELAAGVDRLLEIDIPGDAHFWHTHDEVATLRGMALELTRVSEIKQARLAIADLSEALATLIKATGVPSSFGREVHLLHCPMYRGGSIWLQPKGEPRNPFYGSMMLACFDERQVLPVTGQQE